MTLVSTGQTEIGGDSLAQRAPDADGKFAAPHFLLLLMVLLFFIADGLDMQALGVTVAAISDDWGLPLSAFGTAMAAGHAGAALGALLGGTLGDRLGRRPVMIGGALLFGSLTLCMLLASSPWHLVIMRFIAGIGLGGCLPPGLALLSECMPPKYRSLAVSLAILCSPIGISIAGLMSSTLLPEYGWQMLFLVAGSLPVILAFFLWFTLPESPAFLLKRGGRDAEAKRLLERFGLPEPVAENEEAGKPDKAGFKALLSDGQAVTSISLFGIFFVCYLSMSMVLSWLPALLSNVGFGDGVAGSALATWSTTGMAGVVVSGLLMSRFGTQKIVGLFLIGSISVLAIVAMALPQPGDGDGLQSFYLLIAIGGFMLNATMTTIIAHAANVYQPQIRSTGIGMSTMFGRLGAISGAFIGVYLLELTGANGFFGAVAAALLFAFLLYLIEWMVSRRAAGTVSA